jgi:serine protease Do
MSLFDDDFYSTRVSRRARLREGKEWNGRFGTRRSRSPLMIAFASSFVSAMAAVMIFGVIFGFGGGGDSGGGGRFAAAPVQMADTAERIIQASAIVRPAVVSIINEQMLGANDGSNGTGDSGADGEIPGNDGSNGDSGSGSTNGGSGPEEVVPGEDGGTLQEAGLGSGVIIGKSGGKARIITNYHVVDGAYSLKAMLINGETREAKLIGKDQITDLAVLEIDAKGIDTVAKIGDSHKLRDGETVIAIGNPLGLGDSLTMGIVSKTSRVIPVSLNQDGVIDWEQEVIQIDASINQGNSGGALVNLDGDLVGINSMKVAEYGVEGLGFAIPIDNAIPIVNNLIKYGKVPRPYLGVYTIDLEQYLAQKVAGVDDGTAGSTPGTDSGNAPADELVLPDGVKKGVIVLEAVGPAQKAGLDFNDIIVKLDRQDIGSTIELRKYLYTKKIGDTIDVTYYRDGKKKTLSFQLDEKTDEQ